jgi:hypothetical protein
MLNFESFVRAYNSYMNKRRRYPDSHDFLESYVKRVPLTLEQYKKLYVNYCKQFTRQVATAE